ncbi:hypothetical protein SO802_013500 [Lithocarpus litseifolius]|uniref:F-box domain-containing protein n=1 Tax=Lithocarpus litseifolius TaxID=425828 RepID=A0AAW2D6N5_9ROSI
MEDTVFAKLSDDVSLNIFFKLEDDPQNWARVACVSTKFSSLIRTVRWHNKCTTTIPFVVSDLLSARWLGRPSQTRRVLPWLPPLRCHPQKLRFWPRT